MSIHPIFGVSLDHFTPLAISILQQAYNEAEKRKHATLTILHILHTTLRCPRGFIPNLLQKIGLSSIVPIVMTIEKELDKLFPEKSREENETTKPKIVDEFPNFIRYTVAQAQSFGFSHVAPEHLLLGIYFDPQVSHILQSAGITKKRLIETIRDDLDPAYLPMAGNRESTEQPAENQFIEKFSRNLSRLAENQQIDPVIGRQKEIERLIHILSRRTKNNPILLGEAGVGKTAIIEGLAQAIAQKKVPKQLLNKKIYAVDMTRLVAGTKYRGQFEERLKNFLDGIMSDENNIVFIDEIHTIVGAGGSEDGSMNAANIMKPPLSRGELQCIGATTLDEYSKTIEKDAALARRFQPINVEQPTREETIEILEGLKPIYETYHNVTYTTPILELAVDLSVRFLANRNLPDKAIDIIDEAAAFINASHPARVNPKEKELEDELTRLENEKKEALLNDDIHEAGELQKQSTKIKRKLSALQKKNHVQTLAVTEEDIRQTVSRMSGVPIGNLAETEIQRLLKMEEHLNGEVLGQQQAISAVSRALRRAKAELKDPHRPIASFMFFGASGVGKTLLAHKLAEFIFGNTNSIIRFDMSEFYDKHTASRLIGAPPGYEGHKEGGQLTEQVRRKPYSVVLFDEIEKAHPDVIQVLLQVLEDGTITDGHGHKIDFRNTIIIMTTNAGANAVGNAQKLGFTYSNSPIQTTLEREEIEAALKKNFKTEFVNRIDEFIYFEPLSNETLQNITKLELKKLQKRLCSRKINLIYRQNILKLLTDNQGLKKTGARAIRQIVTQMVEDPLADALLREDVKYGEDVIVTQKNGKLTFVPKTSENIRQNNH